jgi:SAM-dependent methyltransferase
LFARRERERQEADRLYNEALTALDRAIQSAPALPATPPRFDESRLRELNSGWDILPNGAPPAGRSWRGRLRGFIWRLVGPPLEAQKAFNALLVEHVNRNQIPAQHVADVISRLIEALRREFDALVRFESLLLHYLRTVTAYVDTKDRNLGGGDMWERLTLVDERTQALKRELEVRTLAGRQQSPESPRPIPAPLEAPAYVVFEDRFRGSQEDVARRVEDYLPLLTAASDIVDLGCGRGELLDLLRARGIAARGVDMNSAMVELCRSRGLDVEEGDALSFLQRQRDDSIGGLVAIQVVEHFEPAYLVRVLETAWHKMRRGAPLVLETINPACWMAFFETYIRDPTHQRPLHPDTLKYLVQASGFTAVDVQFLRPIGPSDRLARIADEPIVPGDSPWAAMAAALNDHADKLNVRLFSFADYVVIARR